MASTRTKATAGYAHGYGDPPSRAPRQTGTESSAPDACRSSWREGPTERSIGGVHIKAPNRTPLANAMLGVLHALGLNDIKDFGDSEGTIAL